VLLHGWTATAALNFVHVFEPLARDFHVVAMDHRGHGRGIRPSLRRGFRLHDCADDVAALADALELERIIPVGYSMGGPVALLTWRRHPDRVAGLVLCATSGQFPGALGATDLAMRGGVLGVATALRSAPPIVSQRATQVLAERRRANGFPAWAVEEVEGSEPASLVEAAGELRGFNAGAWLAEVDVPTAVVVTGQDQVVPPRRQHQLASAIPEASVWPVEGDHAVCVWQPEVFVPVLSDACRWVSDRAA
jgi:3-oxoadipate enol-lactonase